MNGVLKYATGGIVAVSLTAAAAAADSTPYDHADFTDAAAKVFSNVGSTGLSDESLFVDNGIYVDARATQEELLGPARPSVPGELHVSPRWRAARFATDIRSGSTLR